MSAIIVVTQSGGLDTPCYNGCRRTLAGPSTVRGADASVESVWGRRSRPNEPQRKSDTDTRVDPKTSPVPRLEGNPTFVPKGSSKEEPFGRWPQITNFAIPAPTCLRNAKLRLRYRLPRQVRLNLSDPLANWLVDPVVAYRAPLNFYRVHSLPRSLPTPADLCPWRIRFYPPAGSLGR